MEKDSSKLVLGLVGSPRKLGNCEVFTKEIAQNIQVEHTLNLIRMPSLRILPCNACYACIMGNPCPHNDDMAFLLNEIARADVLIISTPVYYLGAHSIFKRILDRGFLLYTVLEKTYGKPCILINIYGMDDERIGVSPHTLSTLAAFLGLDIRKSVSLKAALPGEIVMTQDGREQAKELAKTLFAEPPTKQEAGCPFCGSEIVRMEPDRFVCALCHGHFTVDMDKNKVKVREGGIFGTLDHMLRHRVWLQGMKERFLRNKKEIIKTIGRYKNIGEWLRE